MNRNPAELVMTLPQAIAWRNTLREAGQRLVITNGCFDVPHRGHAEYMYQSRKFGDALLVLINSDTSVAELKGPTRPIIAEGDRAYMLGALESIDAVVIFDGQRCTNELRALAPDIYVKGGDYTVESLDTEERDVLLAVAADIRFVPFVKGLSTTGIIEKIKLSG